MKNRVKSLLIMSLSAILMTACNSGSGSSNSIKQSATASTSSNVVAPNNSLTSSVIAVQPTVWNIYAADFMRAKINLTYERNSSDGSITGIDVRSPGEVSRGITAYEFARCNNDVLFLNPQNWVCGKSDYKYASINPTELKPIIAAESSLYTQQVYSSLFVRLNNDGSLLVMDTNGSSGRGYYFNGQVNMKASVAKTAFAICDNQLSFAPDTSYSCDKNNYLLASLGVSPKYNDLSATKINLSVAAETSYRNSLQRIPLGQFGLINVIVKNLSDKEVTKIQPLRTILNNTMSFDLNRTTCKTDGSQSLAAGASCSYVIKYLPNIVESGTLNFGVNAMNDTQLLENTIAVDYSSYMK